MLGYHPEVILAGRRINDGMGKFIAEQTIKHMIAAGSYIKGAKVNVLGLTFKENCGDLRNSKVIDIINELSSAANRYSLTMPICSRSSVFRASPFPSSWSPPRCSTFQSFWGCSSFFCW
jgi:UDP-N-acetyl-D-mannosaminuronate dehydrogenase